MLGMQRELNRLPAWLMLALVACGTAAAAPAPNDEAFRREFRRVHAGLSNHGCHDFITPGVALAEQPEFGDRVSGLQRQGFLEKLVDCARIVGRREDMFRAAEVWSRLAPRQRWPQVIRLGYGVEFGRPQSTLDGFEYFARQERAYLARLPLYNAVTTLYAADRVDGAGDRKLAVIETLMRAGFDARPPLVDDFVRFSHARLLLARGRVDDARRALAGVEDLSVILRMRVDALFAPLRADPAFAERLELGVAMARAEAHSRSAAAARPPIILAVMFLAQHLMRTGRLEEALAVVDEALEKHARRPTLFLDGAMHKAHLLGQRAAVLVELDRRDEAVATLLDAANQQVYRRQNVAGMLDLAHYLVMLGRGAQALPLLEQVRYPTRGEQAWAEAIRVCAGTQLGLQAEQAQGLAWLEAHALEKPPARSMALLCAGDVDGAAAWMVHRLSSQSMSSDALLALQRRPPRRMDELPFRRVLLERFAGLRERDEVRAALAHAGHIEDLPVHLEGDF